MGDERFVGERAVRLALGDITAWRADAIVNAANPRLAGGGGVDGRIHAVGGPRILDECARIVHERGPLPPGQAVATTAGQLPARWVIHTVGPIWRGGTAAEAQTLASAYRESLRVAETLGAQTVAFPSISTGAYGYPVSHAAPVAIDAIVRFLREEARSVREVTLVLFDRRTYAAYAAALAAYGHGPVAREP